MIKLFDMTLKNIFIQICQLILLQEVATNST